jgi:hypothetical protein
MALTNIQALDVVVGSVDGVSGQSPNPGQTLKQGGITDSGRLGAFKSVVVTDEQRGVKKHRHEILSSTLSGVAVDDFVQAAADVVRANATPIAAGELLAVDAAAAAPPAPRARKRTAAARRTASPKNRRKKTSIRKPASKRRPARRKASAGRAKKSRGRKRR